MHIIHNLSSLLRRRILENQRCIFNHLAITHSVEILDENLLKLTVFSHNRYFLELLEYTGGITIKSPKRFNLNCGEVQPQKGS